MNEKLLRSGQSLDEWKTHNTVDSLWMSENTLYSGQTLDDWKTILQRAVFGWMKNVFHSKRKHSTDETYIETAVFCFGLLLVLGVKRHVQTTQYKIINTNSKLLQYNKSGTIAKPRLLLVQPVILDKQSISASRMNADISWQFCLEHCGAVGMCRSPSIQTSYSLYSLCSI
jgi:hypothetical protein